MSSAIGPGDWVECLGLAGAYDCWPATGGDVPKAGHIYRVERVAEAADKRGELHPALLLYGIHRYSVRGNRCAFPVERFRPIYRPNSDLIQSLKAPAPDAVRELIAAD